LIRERTKAALSAKKSQVVAKGEKFVWGNQRGMHEENNLAVVSKRGGEATKANAAAFALNLKAQLKGLQLQNLTLTQIAKELNNSNTATARGGQWTAKSVSNVIRRLEVN
jgi:DNA invertase Pin-like site-specific DNA recombinase